jgi:D-arabinose 1-dehydrogenase-like Zn-dependent alcohol dehydrogenase
VLGTGWFGAVAAGARPGEIVAAVGDGAVGLPGVLAARQLGAGRSIAFSRHEPRQKLATKFGATDIITERGNNNGAEKVKELTNGLGADSVIEAVGTQEAMMQAIRSTRPADRSATSVSHTTYHCPARSPSTATCTCTADPPPPCATSCPTSSGASPVPTSTPAKSSTSPSPSNKSPTDTKP